MDLLVSPRIGKSKPVIIDPPLALLQLYSYLKEKGIKTRIVDRNVMNTDFRKMVEAEHPELIGFSLMTSQIKDFIDCMEQIRSIDRKIKVVAGGPHVSVTGEEILHLGADYAVIGEGEQAILDLIEGKPLHKIKNLIYIKNGKAIHNQKKTETDLDKLPFLDYGAVDMNNYVLGNRISMITSRGCPYRCIYCSTPSIQGHKYRQMSPDRVINEIIHHIGTTGITEFKFLDGNFTLDKNFVQSFCQSLMSKNLKITWKCLTRVDLVDESMIRMMKKAGCINISFGIESGDDKILKLLKKEFQVEDVKKAVGLCKKNSIDCGAYFMMGLPNYSLFSLLKTVRLAVMLPLDYISISILEILPGSELYSKSIRNNTINRDKFTVNYINKQPLFLTDNKNRNKVVLPLVFFTYVLFSLKPSQLKKLVYSQERPVLFMRGLRKLLNF